MLCKALLYFNYGIKQRISVAEQLNFNAFVIVITVAPMLLSGIQAKKTGMIYFLPREVGVLKRGTGFGTCNTLDQRCST